MKEKDLETVLTVLLGAVTIIFYIYYEIFVINIKFFFILVRDIYSKISLWIIKKYTTVLFPEQRIEF